MVKDTTTIEQLVELIAQKHGQPYKPAEVVLLCNQLGKLCHPEKMTVKTWGAAQDVTSQLLQGLDPFLSKLGPYEQVVLLASLAKVRYSPSQDWLQRYFDASIAICSQYGPGYITVVLRALTRMDLELWQLKEVPNFTQWMGALLAVAQAKVWAYRGDELVRTMVALGELRWRPPQDFVAAFNGAIKSRLDFLDPPLLSAVMLAYATLRIDPDPSLVRAMYTQLATKLPMLDDHELATTARALTLVKKVARHDFFTDFQAEVLQKLPTFNPHVLANLLSAMAELVRSRQMAPCGPAGVVQVPQRSSRAWLQRGGQAGAQAARPQSAPAVSGARNAGSAAAGDAAAAAKEQAAAAPLKSASESDKAGPGAALGSMDGLERPARPVSAVRAEQSGLEAVRLSSSITSTISRAAQAAAALQAPVANGRALSSMDEDIRRRAAGQAGSNSSAAASSSSSTGHQLLQGPPALWLDCVADRVHELLPHFSPSGMASVMWALSMLGCTASQQMLDDFIAHSRSQLRLMHKEDVVHMAQALANFGYRPTPDSLPAWNAWFDEYQRLAGRRVYEVDQVCDLVLALSALPSRSSDALLRHVLRFTRLNRPTALRHTSPYRLCALAVGLRNLRHKPDFGFLHSFAQGVRFHWTSFQPRDYAAIMSSLVSFGATPLALDELWWSEFLLILQCKVDRFDAGALAMAMRAGAMLPAVQETSVPKQVPSRRWMEAVLGRAAEIHRAFSPSQAASVLWAAAQMSAVLQQRGEEVGEGWVAPTLMSSLVSRVSDGAAVLAPELAAEVAWALEALGQPPVPALQRTLPPVANGHTHANGASNGSAPAATANGVHAPAIAGVGHAAATAAAPAMLPGRASRNGGHEQHGVEHQLVISGLQGELSGSALAPAAAASEKMQFVA